MLLAVQAGGGRDGRRVDDLARSFAGGVGSRGRYRRVHCLRVGFIVLALVVGNRSEARFGLGPGEVDKLPVMAGGGQHDRLSVGVRFAVQAGACRYGRRVDDRAVRFAGRIDGHGRHLRVYPLRVRFIVLALVVRGRGEAGCGLDPGEVHELPVVADGGQVDVLGIGVRFAVQAAGCRDLRGVVDGAGDLAAGFDRSDRDVRVYRPGLCGVGRAPVVGDGGGVAVFVVTGPGEVDEFPSQGLEVDFDDDVVVRHLEAFGGQGLDEFGAVFAVRSPQFDTVEFVVFGRRVNDGDIHQARRGDGGRLAAVADQEGGAVAFRDFDGRQVVLRNVEVTAERLPAAVRIAGRAEVDGDGTGVVRIDDVVARHTVVVMLRARIVVAVVSHAADRAHDLDLIVLGQRGRQAVFSRLVRVHGKGVVFIDLPVGHAADQVEAFDHSPLRNDGHVFRRHGLRNFGIPAREGEERLGRVLGRSFDRIAVSGCDGGKRSLVAFVGQEGDRVFVDLPSGRQGQILSHRRCEVERGLTVLFEPAQERIAFFDRIFRFLGRGPLADGLRIRRRDAVFRDEGHDDRLEQFVNAFSLRSKPQVAFRNGPLVAFCQDVAVFRAGAAGLLIRKYLDAGGGVEYHVPANHHILIDVGIAVGNAVVAVEFAALQVEGTGRCRVDRRAEVGPPLTVGRICVRRVFAAVYRNGSRRCGVVGADRRKVRGNGRAVAVFRSEDRRAAVQDVHAVHAVGALAGSGQGTVLDRQLPAVDIDQSFAVERRAVGRAGQFAVAGDRQIAVGRYRDHTDLGRADFVFVQIQRDGLVNDQLVFLNVLQQDDRVAVLCRRDGGRQCAVRGGLAVSRDGGDRFADRVDAGFFGLDPRVAFRQRAGVAFRLDAAVGRAGGTGLLVNEHVDAGGGVEDHVAPDHDILVDVDIAVGNAVVAVERAALQFEGAGRRRVDRRAEVVPPVVGTRDRICSIFTAVYRNSSRRCSVISADRREVRGNGRAVAVFGAEDGRAALQDVHAVHAVGALAGSGDRAVFDRQLAAGDADQDSAVECCAVGGPGDLAIAGDRQIAIGRYRDHVGLGGAEFVPVQIKRDGLADDQLVFLNILQQDDRVAGLRRRDGFRQRRVQRIVDLRDRFDPLRNDRQIFRRHGRRDIRIPAVEDVAVPGRVLGRSRNRIAVISRDDGKRRLVAFVGQEGDRVFVDLPSGRQGQILSHRRCEVERGLTVLFEPAQERIAFFDRIFRFLGRGPLADGLRIRRRDAVFRDEGHDDRLEQFVNAFSLRSKPQVAFRNGPLVAFCQDVAVFRAGAAGLLIRKYLDAGGGVEYHVPANHHILIDVGIAVGNAVVAVEFAALQVEGTGRCRVDRRAEVGPPLTVGRICVRRVFAAVYRNGSRRCGVVGADRRKVRGNGRAVAVFRSEDRRAAVQDVHAVHAVGALAGSGQGTVLDRQLPAVDIDQSFAVERRAVGRAGQFAVAGDRQIAVGRYRDHTDLGRADFVFVQIQRDGLVNDQLVFLNVLQQDDRVAVLCRRDGGRQCAVRGGLAVSRDGGDRFADRVDAGFFGLDPRVAFRQRAGVAFRLDAAVGRAGGTGLLVDEHVDAGGGVEDHVAPDHHILVDVDIAVGNAVVAVEHAALQFEGASSRRVDRRAEVGPPVIVGRGRVRRVFAAVYCNGSGSCSVISADRSEVRGNGRAVAVRGAEDRRAVLQDVHAVHAVGTLAGGGQRTVFNSQFAAGDVDQSVAVECRAVGRAGDPAVAGDRQIAVSRHRKHAGLGGAEFVPVQIKRDRLADFKLIFLNVLQQDDRIAGLCRRDGFRQRRIIRVVDPGDVLEPSRGDRDVCFDLRVLKVKQLIIRAVPAEEGVAFPNRGRPGRLAAPVKDLVGDVGAAVLNEGHRHFDPGPVDDVDHVARDSRLDFGDPGISRIEFVAFPGDGAQVALELRRRLAVLDVISFEDVAEAVGIDDLLRNALPGRHVDDVGSFDRVVDALDLGALLQPAVEDVVLLFGIRDPRGRLVQDGIQFGLHAVHVVDDLGLPLGGQRDGFRHGRFEVIGGFRVRQEPAAKGEAGFRGRVRGLFDGGVLRDLQDRDVAVVVLVVRVEGDVDRIVQFVHAGVFFTFRDLHQDLVSRYADVRLLAVVGEVAAVDEAGQRLVACHRVGGYGRGVVGDEAAAVDVGDRRTARIIAGFHDQRVAGRISAAGVVGEVGRRAGRVQRAAGDIHGTALLVDSRRAGDRAAGDRQRAGVGLEDGDFLRGRDRAAVDRDGVIIAEVAARADRRTVAAGGADGAAGDRQAGSVQDVDRIGAVCRRRHRAAVDRHGRTDLSIDTHAADRVDSAAVDRDGRTAGSIDPVVEVALQCAGLQNKGRAVLNIGRDAADDLAAADGILERKRRAAAHRVEERIAIAAQGVAGQVDRDGFRDLDPGGHFDVLEDLDGIVGGCRCHSGFERAEVDVADLRDRFRDDPVIAVLDRSLARRNVFGLGLQRIFAAGDEAGLVLGVHDLRAALGGFENTAGDIHRDLREVIRAVALRIAFVERRVAHDRAAGDV